MQCPVPGGQTSGVFSVHAVVVTILFNAVPGRQLPLTAGVGPHAQKGNNGQEGKTTGTWGP